MKIYVIPSIIFVLSLLSVLTLTSIAPSLAPKQFIFFVVGFLIFFATANWQYFRFKKISHLGYAFLCFLLVFTLIFAENTRGSRRWIDIGSLFSIQPSQLAIPIVGIFLSHFIEQNPLTKLKNLVYALCIVAVPAILILISPDLGTTLVFLMSVGVIFYLTKTEKKHILPMFLASIIVLIFSFEFILRPYQRDRITSFLYTTTNNSEIEVSKDKTYNARQALIAVGSGQILGKGLGQGIQSHLRFLPERQTDFIFASFAEEFGFLGSLVVLFLYISLIATVIKIGHESETKSEFYYCYVVATMTTIQAGVNIGMNIGILPITGVTLPFFSYGGSSILVLSFMFGLVQSISKDQKNKVTLHLT